MHKSQRSMIATEISLTGFEFHPRNGFPSSSLSLTRSLPLGVFHAQLPFFSPPAVIHYGQFPANSRNFRTTSRFRASSVFYHSYSLPLSSHPPIRNESLAAVISADLSLTCLRYVVIFTPGITLKSCIYKTDGKIGESLED